MKNKKIQLIRGLAIIAVVMIHTCPMGLKQVIYRPFINFPVATFIFLSGFLTDINKIKQKDFYKKRILKVLIPYLIWTILYTTASFYLYGIDIKKYLINFIFASAAAPLYYIFVYIQLVLLTPMLGKLLKSKFWYFGFLVSPIFLLFKYFLLLRNINLNHYVELAINVLCLGWLFFYYFGLYIKNKKSIGNLNIICLIVSYIISIVLQMIEGYIMYKNGIENCGTQMKITSMVTSFLFILIVLYYLNNKKYNHENKFLVLVGDYSFSIYLVHVMVLEVLTVIIPFWNKIPFFINSFIVLIITICFIFIGRKIFGEKLGKYIGLY